MGLELAPELVEPGRRDGVVEPDLRTVSYPVTGPVVAGVAAPGRADLLAVGVGERVGVLAQDDDVGGGAEIRLEIADPLARARVLEAEDELRLLAGPNRRAVSKRDSDAVDGLGGTILGQRGRTGASGADGELVALDDVLSVRPLEPVVEDVSSGDGE